MSKIQFQITAEEVEENKPRKNFGPGNYKFTILEVSSGKSPEKKTPRLEVKMTVEHDDRDFSVFDDIYLTDNSKWKYIMFLNGLGIDPTDEDLDTDDMAGIEGVLRLRPKVGSNYMEVGEYYSASAKDLEPLGPFEYSAKPSPGSEDNVPF
jgi:hypothetical protein